MTAITENNDSSARNLLFHCKAEVEEEEEGGVQKLRKEEEEKERRWGRGEGERKE